MHSKITKLVTIAEHVTEDLASTRWCLEVYKLNSLQILKENGWRCARCRGAKRLQIHHRRYRSHGDTRAPKIWRLCAGIVTR